MDAAINARLLIIHRPRLNRQRIHVCMVWAFWQARNSQCFWSTLYDRFTRFAELQQTNNYPVDMRVDDVRIRVEGKGYYSVNSHDECHHERGARCRSAAKLWFIFSGCRECIYEKYATTVAKFHFLLWTDLFTIRVCRLEFFTLNEELKTKWCRVR